MKHDLFPHDNELEKLPTPEREKRMNDKLQTLIKYAYENAPGFKSRLDKAGVKPDDIKAAVDLQKVPVLHKTI